jgi:hypothetical protein
MSAAAGDDRLERERALARRHLGDDVIDRWREVSPDLEELTSAFAFDDLWSRPGLARRDRSIVAGRDGALRHPQLVRAAALGAGDADEVRAVPWRAGPLPSRVVGARWRSRSGRGRGDGARPAWCTATASRPGSPTCSLHGRGGTEGDLLGLGGLRGRDRRAGRAGRAAAAGVFVVRQPRHRHPDRRTWTGTSSSWAPGSTPP